MWFFFIIPIAAIISLMSMRAYLRQVQTHRKEKEQAQIAYKTQLKTYLLINPRDLRKILEHLYQYLLHNPSTTVTLEIFTMSTTEVMITMPLEAYELLSKHSTLYEFHNALEQLTPYKQRFIIKDTLEAGIGYQIIFKVKKENVLVIGFRTLTMAPDNYVYSGIDEYKWEEMYKQTFPSESIVTTLGHLQEYTSQLVHPYYAASSASPSSSSSELSA